MHETPTATVHIGIVAMTDRPATDATEGWYGAHMVPARLGVWVEVDGTSFTAWSEQATDADPAHVYVEIPRPTDEDGTPTDDCNGWQKREARRDYADLARAAVLDLLDLDPSRYRLADYVAVDLSEEWGEDSEIVGLWA